MRFRPPTGLRGLVRRFVLLHVILLFARAVFGQSGPSAASSGAQEAEATEQTAATTGQFGSVPGLAGGMVQRRGRIPILGMAA